jgi:hypothetical protein
MKPLLALFAFQHHCPLSPMFATVAIDMIAVEVMNIVPFQISKLLCKKEVT